LPDGGGAAFGIAAGHEIEVVVVPVARREQEERSADADREAA
jgi:hypothetical protein